MRGSGNSHSSRKEKRRVLALLTPTARRRTPPQSRHQAQKQYVSPGLFPAPRQDHFFSKPGFWVSPRLHPSPALWSSDESLGGHRARFACLFLRLHPPASANLRPGEEAHSARLQDPASSPGGPRPPAVTLEAAPGHRWTLRTVKTPGSRGRELNGTSSAAETPGYALWS